MAFLVVVYLFVTTVSNVHTQETEPCSGSACSSGICYERYNGDCTRYILCTVANGAIKRSVTKCPFGQYFDFNAISCRISTSVDCPHEPCRNKTDGTVYLTSGLGCGSYWTCVGERSEGKCCPPQWAYKKEVGCTKTPCDDPDCQIAG